MSVALNLSPDQRRVRRAADSARWYAKHREKIRLRHKEWRKSNRGKAAKKSSDWRKKNPGMTAAQRRWIKRNKWKVNEDAARRKSAKLNATPKWANRFFIQEIYSLAVLRTKITGIRWEVDHVIPLNGIGVRGLHWEGNLQVITAVENRKKSNRV